jgi:hypothetical protein
VDLALRSTRFLLSHTTVLDGANITGETISLDEPVKDEFRWRKYGQKLVKGSEFPRSYFKCSIKSCTAKKYCEKFLDNQDQVVKFRTVYLDKHVHPLEEIEMTTVASNEEFLRIVASFFNQARAGVEEHDLQAGVSLAQPLEETAAPTERKKRPVVKTDKSKTKPASGSSDDNRLVLVAPPPIDPMIDGFPWRKYGRKSIKGSDVPREYFRCSRAECPVKKQIEPHSDGSHTVTYENPHNHVIDTDFVDRKGIAHRQKASAQNDAQKPTLSRAPTQVMPLPQPNTRKRKTVDRSVDPTELPSKFSKTSENGRVPTAAPLPKPEEAEKLNTPENPSRLALSALSQIFGNSDVADALRQFDDYAGAMGGSSLKM